MKIESLAVIFLIIILPISLVLSEYVDNKITTQKNNIKYDAKLFDVTLDAIKIYQKNTVSNSFGDISNRKISDIEASIDIFFDSLMHSFGYKGYKSDAMKEYVPAIVFTMYDGYYLYSPFYNTLTETSSYDDEYSKNGEIQSGLKPYVYYSCRYKKDGINGFDFIITYTLDNYVTIQGTIKNKYIYDYGYIYSIAGTQEESNNYGGIYKANDNSYYFNGVQFKENDTEELKEFVGIEEYSYVKINGKKYYLDENYYTDRGTGNRTVNGITFKASAGIFFMDDNGVKNYSQVKGYSSDNKQSENDEFLKYYKAIKYNKSAYEYYKNAYEFSQAVFGHAVSGYKDKMGNEIISGYGLSSLSTKDAYIYQNPESSTTSISEYGEFNIFESTRDVRVESETSNFNQHRKSIIRYVVETNLIAAISSFSSNATDTFLMPKISETDWELIENDVCVISFLQGLNIGSKKYNGYAVVPNSLTNEHVGEEDIFILTKEGDIKTYAKTNDKTTTNSNILKKEEIGYYPGVLKLNFEQKLINNSDEKCYYYPMSYKTASGTVYGYFGNYSSIYGNSGNDNINGDMYNYIRSSSNVSSETKKAYLVALGRERWGAYNINNINYELNDSNGNVNFLKDY